MSAMLGLFHTYQFERLEAYYVHDSMTDKVTAGSPSSQSTKMRSEVDDVMTLGQFLFRAWRAGSKIDF
jgi:hypothetical protein